MLSWKSKSACNYSNYLFPFLQTECYINETVLDAVSIIKALKVPVLFLLNRHLGIKRSI